MNKKLFEELNSYIDKLINIIVDSNDVELLQIITLKLSIPSKHTLTSHYNQLLYLAGLVLNYSRKESRDITSEEPFNWKEIEELLEKIFWQYLYIFLPDSNLEVNELTKEWFHVRDVTMPTFLQYFNEPILCQHDQLIDRFINLYVPFDKLLEKEIRLSVDCTLKIINWIEEEIQKKYDNFINVREEAKREQEAFASRWQEEKWSEEDAKEAIKGTKLEKLRKELWQLPNDIFIIRPSDLINTFGDDVANNYLSLFTSQFNNESAFRYITDHNQIVDSPLVKIGENQMICLHIRLLYTAAFNQFYKIIKKSNIAQSFYENRSNWVEDKTYQIVKDFFTDGKVYKHIYETKDGHDEHDILLLVNDRVIIIEVKASPLKEPLRDPEKAFIRIRDAFYSKKGIQYAYEQGLHLKNNITKNKNIQLYDDKGKSVVQIEENDFRNGVSIICVTADNFGSLATDLSLLLNKPDVESFPYAVNLYDFEILLHGFIKEQKDAEDFLKYMDDRSKLHGKVYTFDELDIAGYFLMYDGFGTLLTAKEKHILDISFSSIFDKHYFAEYGTELPQDKREKNGPYNVEISRKGSKITSGIKGYPETYSIIDLSIKHSEKKSEKRNSNTKKPGRNDPCTCGSGKKYKKCCGKIKF